MVAVRSRPTIVIIVAIVTSISSVTLCMGTHCWHPLPAAPAGTPCWQPLLAAPASTHPPQQAVVLKICSAEKFLKNREICRKGQTRMNISSAKHILLLYRTSVFRKILRRHYRRCDVTTRGVTSLHVVWRHYRPGVTSLHVTTSGLESVAVWQRADIVLSGQREGDIETAALCVKQLVWN